MGVILGQTTDVIFQSVQCPGRDDAPLSHRAAEKLAVPARRFDQIARTSQRRTDRRAEAEARFVKPPPDLAQLWTKRYHAFRKEWFSRIVDLYAHSDTTLVFVQVGLVGWLIWRACSLLPESRSC